MNSDKKILSLLLLMSQSYTGYLSSLFSWATDVISAPCKVIADKAYDAYYNGVTRDDHVQRVFPKSKTIDSVLSYLSYPTEIYDRLYLGNAINAACKETLKQLNIKYIINVTADLSNYHPDEFTYYNIKIRDNGKESIKKYFKESFEKIEEYLNNNNGNVLIHCQKGASRSATLAINYISKKDGKDVTQVLCDIKTKRPIINITAIFLEDLNDIDYSSELEDNEKSLSLKK